MRPWIALLRGINVGGNRIVPMKELASLLERAGLADVRTYIQSGNVVFRSAASRSSLEKTIAGTIAKRFGFEPRVLVLAVADLERAAAACPFDGPSSHLWFLAAPARKPDLAAMNALKSPTERFALKDSVFYLHAPDGIGRSKLAEKVEKLLGVDATARNWNTVTKVLALAQEAP